LRAGRWQQRGEAVVLIGPSGCGKSTFLRCLNQLEIADSGRITIGGVTIVGGQPPRTQEERESSGSCDCAPAWFFSRSTCFRT